VLNEPLTPGMLIGFPLVILGSYLGTTRASPRETRNTAESRV